MFPDVQATHDRAMADLAARDIMSLTSELKSLKVSKCDAQWLLVCVCVCAASEVCVCVLASLCFYMTHMHSVGGHGRHAEQQEPHEDHVH